MSHPEELELLEHGRTGWERFVGVEHEKSPFDHGQIWKGVQFKQNPRDLVDYFEYLGD